jgi:hypothetical protein
VEAGSKRLMFQFGKCSEGLLDRDAKNTSAFLDAVWREREK